tara:strand:- start:2196 stop:2459 length:264 start_codon:yes stop_codon:yes gene_type:complete
MKISKIDILDDYELGREMAKITSNIKGQLSDRTYAGFYYQSGIQMFESGGSLDEPTNGEQQNPQEYKKGFTDAYHANYANNCKECDE